MSQYKVAKMLFNADHPLKKEEIARKINVQPATVGDTLRKLRRKDYAERVGQNQFVSHEEFTEEQLGRMEPMVISGGDLTKNDDD